MVTEYDEVTLKHQHELLDSLRQLSFTTKQLCFCIVDFADCLRYTGFIDYQRTSSLLGRDISATEIALLINNGPLKNGAIVSLNTTHPDFAHFTGAIFKTSKGREYVYGK